MGVYNLELSIMNAKMLCTEGPSFEGWLMVRAQRSTATVESLVRTTFLGAFVGHHQDATAQGMSNDSDHELDSRNFGGQAIPVGENDVELRKLLWST